MTAGIFRRTTILAISVLVLLGLDNLATARFQSHTRSSNREALSHPPYREVLPEVDAGMHYIATGDPTESPEFCETVREFGISLVLQNGERPLCGRRTRANPLLQDWLTERDIPRPLLVVVDSASQVVYSTRDPMNLRERLVYFVRD